MNSAEFLVDIGNGCSALLEQEQNSESSPRFGEQSTTSSFYQMDLTEENLQSTIRLAERDEMIKKIRALKKRVAANPQPKQIYNSLAAKEHVLHQMRSVLNEEYRNYGWRVADMFFRNRQLVNTVENNPYYTNTLVKRVISGIEKLIKGTEPDESPPKMTKSKMDTAPNLPVDTNTRNTQELCAERERNARLMNTKLFVYIPKRTKS
jgi:hypothetical protein